MSVWLGLGLAAAGVDLILLVLVGSVWVHCYRQHGASRTLGLLVFGAFLAAQNAVWLYF
jgi:hypothetical protein